VSLLLSVSLRLTAVPSSLFVIYGFVALALTAASRVSYRVLDQARTGASRTARP